jgi:hypothetical protein
MTKTDDRPRVRCDGERLRKRQLLGRLRTRSLTDRDASVENDPSATWSIAQRTPCSVNSSRFRGTRLYHYDGFSWAGAER